MRHESESPLRVVITGIDGAGKSTTAGIIAERMGREYRLVKPGPSRPVYTIIEGDKQYHYQRIIGLIDRLHGLADKTKKPEFIGAVNAINVLLNGRAIEPSLIRRFQPELVLGARDFYIDPSVYSIVYQPRLARKPMNERIDFLRTVIGAPFRDVVFFLTVSPKEAVIRIERRIAQEKQNPGASEREKWRHMHENQETLTLLQHEYYRTLTELQTRSPVHIYEINTLGMPQLKVADFIVDTIRDHIEKSRNYREEGSKWMKIENEVPEQRAETSPVVVYNSV
jgi:thymidylate kinase